MRGSYRKGLTTLLAAGVLASVAACGDSGDTQRPSSATVRAERRAYDGAPPVVPHDDFGMTCSACHDEQGMPVDGVGYAPASPHDGTSKDYSTQRCRQCHVFSLDDGVFVANDWTGLQQDLSPGGRLTATSPPTIPHATLMRENCLACHSGPAARAEIVTTHPERERCTQCHVAVLSTGLFSSAFSAGQSRPEGS